MRRGKEIHIYGVPGHMGSDHIEMTDEPTKKGALEEQQVATGLPVTLRAVKHSFKSRPLLLSGNRQ